MQTTSPLCHNLSSLKSILIRDYVIMIRPSNFNSSRTIKHVPNQDHCIPPLLASIYPKRGGATAGTTNCLLLRITVLAGFTGDLAGTCNPSTMDATMPPCGSGEIFVLLRIVGLLI